MRDERAAALEREFDEQVCRHRVEVADYVSTHAAELAAQGIHPEGFALPLRPMLLTGGQLAHLQQAIDVFWGALLKVFFIEYGGDIRRIGKRLKLDESIVECLERNFAPERAVTDLFGRSDGFAVGGNIVFIEQNISSGPGGIPAVDALSRFFDAFPPLRSLREHTTIGRLSPLESYTSLFNGPGWAGTTIGYIDAVMPDGSLWDDDGLRFLAALSARGIHLVDLTAKELVCRDDGLHADGERIDRVYRGVAALGLWHRFEELAPVYEACRRGLLHMTTSPYEMVFFDKLLLVYLSDPALSPWLNYAERRVLANVVPWTRFLRDEPVTYGARTLPVPDLCIDRREELVIKRGNGFGSEAVVIGADCDARGWREHVDTALAEENWVVQELVDAPRVRLPYLVDGDVEWFEAVPMACPYVVRGEVCGLAGRTSVPGGHRILVGAGAEGSSAGIRTAFRVG
ncbi:MAG TPA: hypothetical protein VFC19_40935 [Candidatus Limnocylindrales bacterium]|nr:hypothetical protein [Candidatus Limnocylindrales bacterium]